MNYSSRISFCAFAEVNDGIVVLDMIPTPVIILGREAVCIPICGIETTIENKRRFEFVECEPIVEFLSQSPHVFWDIQSAKDPVFPSGRIPRVVHYRGVIKTLYMSCILFLSP